MLHEFRLFDHFERGLTVKVYTQKHGTVWSVYET